MKTSLLGTVVVEIHSQGCYTQERGGMSRGRDGGSPLLCCFHSDQLAVVVVFNVLLLPFSSFRESICHRRSEEVVILAF